MEGASPLKPPIDEQPYCNCALPQRRGGDIKKRGFAPLRHPSDLTSFKGEEDCLRALLLLESLLSLVSKDYALFT